MEATQTTTESANVDTVARLLNDLPDEVRAKNQLIELLCKSYNGSTKHTRKLNGYTTKSSDKLSLDEMRKLSKNCDIDLNRVSAYELSEYLDAESIKIAHSKTDIQQIYMNQIMLQASINKDIEKSIKAIIAVELEQLEVEAGFNEANADSMRLHEMDITDLDVFKAFGFVYNTLFIIVLVNQNDYAVNDNLGLRGDDNAITNNQYRHVKKIRTYSDEADSVVDSHLSVNIHSIHEISHLVNSYLCGKKSGGCGSKLSLFSIRGLYHCPKCGNSKSNMTKQQIQIYLPMVNESGKIPQKNGYPQFNRVRLNQRLSNMLINMKANQISNSEFIEELMACESLKVYSRKGTQSDSWRPCEVKPMCFDVEGQPYLGLGVVTV
jgi:hypothetical protein